MMLIHRSVNSDWLFNAQLGVLQADWFILGIDEKATLNIYIPCEGSSMVVGTTSLVFCAAGCSVGCCTVNPTVSTKSVVPPRISTKSVVPPSPFECVSSITDWVEGRIVAVWVDSSSVAVRVDFESSAAWAEVWLAVRVAARVGGATVNIEREVKFVLS